MLLKGQLPWSKKIIKQATLLLDNKYTSAKTTVTKHCPSIVFGLGAWGLHQLATLHPPMTIGNNAAKRTTPLIPKKAIKWATLLLDNECALERTSVLNCCTSILLGYGAWGLWQLANITHQKQSVTMLQKGQLPSSKKWVINWATLFLDSKCTLAWTTILNCCASIVFGLGAWGLQQLATNTHQQQSATMLPKGQLPWSKKISYQTRSYLATGQWMHLGKNYCHKPLHKCCAWIGCLRSLTTGNQHPPTPIGNNAA